MYNDFMNFNFFKLQTKISFKNVGIAYNPKVESAFTYSQAIKDIFEANVYVMSPKGRVIDLPNGSTPIDFAYKIHTQVGRCAAGLRHPRCCRMAAPAV